MTASNASLQGLHDVVADLKVALALDSTVRHAGEHELIYEQGAHPTNHLLVVEGIVRVLRKVPGQKDVILHRLTAGDVCVVTATSLVAKTPYPVSAVAQSTVILSQVSEESFDRLLGASYSFRNRLLLDYSHRFNKLIVGANRGAAFGLDSRVAQTILNLRMNKFTVKTTHSALADEIGTVREVVTRSLIKLAGKGLISQQRGFVTILDLERLTQFANA